METTYPLLVPKPISEHVLDELRRSIITGALGPGQRLIESQIAKEMGISRAPVREAIRQLQQEGLVVNAPWRGPSVIAMTPEDIRHLYRVRIALENLALQLIIERNDDTIVAELDAIVRAIAEAADKDDLVAVVEQELLFHKTICERADNPLLARLYHSIIAQVRIGLALLNASYIDLHAVAPEHQPLIDAIQLGDVATATAAMHAHIWGTVEAVIAQMEVRTSGERADAD